MAHCFVYILVLDISLLSNAKELHIYIFNGH